MQNFDYQTPTRLIFGKGVVKQLPDVMEQFGKKNCSLTAEAVSRSLDYMTR
ncbi:hypothetical protein SAMN02910436_01989 [Ruminococcaceae bacterium P7]|nr:hypothetical protein SAMN02910436_01989 [Ruminococcaceae bacterium P7]